jgi:hypothetical protein
MNYGIQYVCWLVHKKNELNRKRRRFYHILNSRQKYVEGYDGVLRPVWKKRRRVPITKAYARKMYKVTKEEMKAMTAEMRKARKEINAQYIWSSWGAIKRVEVGDEVYAPDLIARMSDMWEADSILLGDK